MTKLFNQCSEVTTTHLWKREPGSPTKVFGLEGDIPLPHNCVTEGSLPDGTKIRILFDTGTTRSFMSKNFYMRNRQLHSLPKFTSPCKAIMVGSGQCISVLFVIPIIVTIGTHTSSRPVEISPSSPVGVVDLRSLGYFKVKYKDLVSCLSTKFTMYHYIKAPPDPDAEDVYLHTTIHNPSQSGRRDPYPWLESSDPCQHMSDLQILYDRIDLSDSILTSHEKSKLMALIVKYKKVTKSVIAPISS